MAAVNRVILVGNLGADPETRYLPAGDAVTNIRLAITERYKDKQTGEMKEITEWVRISFFKKLAEVAGQYLKKGSPVYVEGKIRTRKWQDSNGQDKYSTEIVADAMQLLGSKNQESGGGAPQRSQQQPRGEKSAPASGDGFDDNLDDCPF